MSRKNQTKAYNHNILHIYTKQLEIGILNRIDTCLRDNVNCCYNIEWTHFTFIHFIILMLYSTRHQQ